MLCYIYRSNKKPGAFLYLAKRDDFDDLPEDMMQIFGTPEFSMSINLTTEKQLAQEDSKEVLSKLELDGYFLQLPKSEFDINSIEENLITSLYSEK